jgi:spore coat polysaccharide biosynthesis protein SpsF
MGSTRLPGKVVESIAGRPLLEHIIGRLALFRHPAHIVVATSDSEPDDVIDSFCLRRSIDCFRGSEADVLGRYFECALKRGLDQIVRLTGDNPFTDIYELDRLIDYHVSGRYDYSSSLEMLPVGVGAEIFSYRALEHSFIYGHAPHHREHVNEYILENTAHFRTGCLAVQESKRHPEVRMTVDTSEDLRRARFLAVNAAGPWLTTEEAIKLCSLFV